MCRPIEIRHGLLNILFTTTIIILNENVENGKLPVKVSTTEKKTMTAWCNAATLHFSGPFTVPRCTKWLENDLLAGKLFVSTKYEQIEPKQNGGKQKVSTKQKTNILFVMAYSEFTMCTF